MRARRESTAERRGGGPALLRGGVSCLVAAFFWLAAAPVAPAERCPATGAPPGRPPDRCRTEHRLSDGAFYPFRGAMSWLEGRDLKDAAKIGRYEKVVAAAAELLEDALRCEPWPIVAPNNLYGQAAIVDHYLPNFWLGICQVHQGDCDAAKRSFLRAKQGGCIDRFDVLESQMEQLRSACRSAGGSGSSPSPGAAEASRPVATDGRLASVGAEEGACAAKPPGATPW